MKQKQLTISTTDELKSFVNRTDVDIQSAFDVANSFMKVFEPDTGESRITCIVFGLYGGTNEPDFTKDEIIKWIDKYEQDRFNCVSIFSFK